MTAARYYLLATLGLISSTLCFAAPVSFPATSVAVTLPSKCYLQGMSYQDQRIWLSCGLYGQSKIYIVSSQTGDVLSQQTFSRYWFAEGNTIIDDKVVQLTWKNGVIVELEKNTLNLGQRYPLRGEGWGVSYHHQHGLVMSDGSASLTWLDPTTYAKKKSVIVHDGDYPISQLNELEWVEDLLWANIWQQARIAIIDPHNGRVLHWLDLSALTAEQQNDAGEVLNGIAYLPDKGQVWISGKNWQKIYSIDISQLHPHISNNE